MGRANDRPALTLCSRSIVIFGIEEAVKEAQNGGSGVVIYFRKEGRALGEVTKVPKHHKYLHKSLQLLTFEYSTVSAESTMTFAERRDYSRFISASSNIGPRTHPSKARTARSLLIHWLHTVVYNARKRGEDRASDYFKRTENVAGVKDMRFQALMPDILHWLGITKIDRMLSMSKYVCTPP